LLATTNWPQLATTGFQYRESGSPIVQQISRYGDTPKYADMVDRDIGDIYRHMSTIDPSSVVLSDDCDLPYWQQELFSVKLHLRDERTDGWTKNRVQTRLQRDTSLSVRLLDGGWHLSIVGVLFAASNYSLLCACLLWRSCDSDT